MLSGRDDDVILGNRAAMCARHVKTGYATGGEAYVWKTPKAWAGTCGQLDVKLIDGTIHSAYFKLLK